MKRMRIMGLCLAAVFAFAAFAASSASALPEVAICVAKAGGKYKESNCNAKAGTKAEEKKFELSKVLTKTGFTGSSPEAFLETESGTKITCTGSTAKGNWDYDEAGSPPKPTPTKEVEHVFATFTGCTLGVAKAKCSSAGAAEKEIKTLELLGPLGELNKTTHSAGAELKPAKAKGKFAEFECEGFGKILVGEGTGKLGDCIIATVTSKANEMTTTGTELYTGIKGPEGQEQTPQHFEGKTTHCNLESKIGEGGWERSVQNQEETLTFEEAAEIRA